MKRRKPQIIDQELTAAMHFKDKRSYCRRGKVFRFGDDMTQLRTIAFQRSKGFCEMTLRGVLGQRCNRNISWQTFELHHDPPLSQGGDDSIEGVLCSCRRCHHARHRHPRFGEKV